MNINMKKQLNRGFILFITLIMLIIFAILGIGLYQQTTMSTQTVQYVTFKQEAEDLAMLVLNELEANIGDRAGESWQVCENKGNPTKKDSMLCDKLPDEMINSALSDLKEGKAPQNYDSEYKWQSLDKKGSFSGDGKSYYVIQQLGKDRAGTGGANIGYLLYRITIITQVLDTFSVISSVTAIPENSGARP